MGPLDRSRVACDLERVEVLLELMDQPSAVGLARRGNLCSAFLQLGENLNDELAKSHNSLAAVALKDLVRVKDDFIETLPLTTRKCPSAPQLFHDKDCGPPTANCQPRSEEYHQPNTTSLLREVALA